MRAARAATTVSVIAAAAAAVSAGLLLADAEGQAGRPAAAGRGACYHGACHGA
jgi:hypothetical protein